jgi:hypothetical protein
MPKKLRFPSRVLLGWLTVNAHLIVVGALFGLFTTTGAKLGIATFDAGGFCIISAVFLGRHIEWTRHSTHARTMRHNAEVRGTRATQTRSTRSLPHEQAA